MPQLFVVCPSGGAPMIYIDETFILSAQAFGDRQEGYWGDSYNQAFDEASHNMALALKCERAMLIVSQGVDITQAIRNSLDFREAERQKEEKRGR